MYNGCGRLVETETKPRMLLLDAEKGKRREGIFSCSKLCKSSYWTWLSGFPQALASRCEKGIELAHYVIPSVGTSGSHPAYIYRT